MLDPSIFGTERPGCSIPGCTRDALKQGMCDAHWQRKRRGSPLDAPFRARRKKGQEKPPCSVPGCYRPVKCVGLCSAHYRRKLLGNPDLMSPVEDRRPKALTTDFSVRVLKDCSATLDRQAKAMGLSRGALVRLVLEKWASDVTARKREGL